MNQPPKPPFNRGIDKYDPEDYLSLIKARCQWCLTPLLGTWYHYVQFGNSCMACSARAERVVNKLMTRAQANAQQLAAIKKNLWPGKNTKPKPRKSNSANGRTATRPGASAGTTYLRRKRKRQKLSLNQKSRSITGFRESPDGAN